MTYSPVKRRRKGQQPYVYGVQTKPERDTPEVAEEKRRAVEAFLKARGATHLKERKPG